MSDQQLPIISARELIPLYVAGQLEPTVARMLEEVLKDNESLQEDLRMWRVIAQVTRNRSPVKSESHIDAESLVAFAENATPLSLEMHSKITEHLRGCGDCRADLQMIRESLAPESRPRRGILLTPVWRYAAAAVVLLAILGTFLTIRQSSAPDQVGELVTLRLPFLESYRSPGDATLPTPQLEIATETELIVLQVEVPLSVAASRQLDWSLRGTEQQWADLNNPTKTGVDSTGYALVWLELSESDFPRSGAYTLRAVSASDGEFVYDFIVTGR